MSLEKATAWQPDGRGAWVGVLDDTWAQGRTTFGGVLTAGAVRALRTLEPDRPPVEVHTRYLAPLSPGAIRCTTAVLRQGRWITHVRAELHGRDANLAAVVDATLAVPRPSPDLHIAGSRRPDGLPQPQSLPSLPHLPGRTPAFLQHVDLRWTTGGAPFSGDTRPRVGGWCRPIGPPPAPEVVAVALLDAWPSPALTLLEHPAPASTISWTAWLHHLPEHAHGWWWYREDATYAAHGIATSAGHLYAPDGRIAATRGQVAAVYP